MLSQLADDEEGSLVDGHLISFADTRFALSRLVATTEQKSNSK